MKLNLNNTKDKNIHQIFERKAHANEEKDFNFLNVNNTASPKCTSD